MTEFVSGSSEGGAARVRWARACLMNELRRLKLQKQFAQSQTTSLTKTAHFQNLVAYVTVSILVCDILGKFI